MGYRKEKIEELIKRVVSEVLLTELKDPRIGFTTVTGVNLSKDYSVAKVGISILGSAREMRKTLEGLDSSIGYVQHRVGKELKLRQTPRIQFALDPSIAEGTEMVDFLEKLTSESDSSDAEPEPEADKE